MDAEQDGNGQQSAGWGSLYLRGLETAVGGNAQAFGFSITVTVTFGVISSSQGAPSQAELLGFALSAVAAFSGLNLLVAHLLGGKRPPAEPSRVVLIATATDILAVGAGVAAAIGTSAVVTGWGAWALAPFCSGLVYVLVQSIELTVGLRRSRAREQ